MPGFDGTGPAGQGPMTGGGRGFCAGVMTGTRPAFPGFFGRGGGRGRRNRFFATGLTGWQRAGIGDPLQGSSFSSGKEETEILKNQAKYFEEQLKSINERIALLEKDR
ncbi:MAG: DUF5320 domain-containing protein [Candidatus Firestonebacteria bacterium]